MTPLRPGECVQIWGLESRLELNGRTGELLSFVSSRDRWQVQLDGVDIDEKPLGLKAVNIEPKRRKESAALLSEMIEESPVDANLHCNLAVALEHSGDIDGAIRSYEAAIDFNPSHRDALLLLGPAYERKGERSKAILACQRALDVHPEHSGTHYRLHFLLRQSGELQSSIECCRRAIRADPKMANAYVSLADCLAEVGDTSGAVVVLRQALEQTHSRASSYCTIASALEQLDDLDGAVAGYRAALRENPEHADAKKRLDEVLCRPRLD